ncbi:altronate dehydratase family protein [Paraburkholderia sp.]|uniref:UxaA family hydrolase n=1 Tax=Paraburkholderia sp. TaxID=1926495 RepID=UPI002D5CFCAE|nr:altronate dehydratase family protein [Paraburkholderia sp.]HZZ02329.1 altronate dehydratase family protein [Paraburkholderia sp.]
MGGMPLVDENTVVSGLIPPGHKVATSDIAAGAPVRRYGQIIGFASQPIRAGEHVHVHNVAMGEFDRDYAFSADVKPIGYVAQSATFQGLVRENGRVATRNYIGILTTVNCSATVAKGIAGRFDGESLARFPNVDGVVALTHPMGCCIDTKGEGMRLLQRTLAGYARHPNFAGILVVGLGCEANQIAGLFGAHALEENDLLRTFTIQDSGGTSKAIAKGAAIVLDMLGHANRATRRSVPASHLVLGLECGGSDGYSGITANPALGAAADLLVRHGGAAVLSETPEIYGAEHLLTRRAVSPEVGRKLIERIRWWEDHAARNHGEMNNNPTPGNKAGGLTTILEKSLGAVAKGGTMNLQAVYEYAESIIDKGFSFMDTPGYDPISVTGLVAGGANVVCFTTGRGSAYGCAPSPSLKLSTNTALWHRQQEDIDINCGSILDGEHTVQQMGQAIFELVLRTASGEKTKSERHGYGQNEFMPWFVGAVM